MPVTDATVREWAREQGIEVPPRGRLAPKFRDMYAEAFPLADVDDDDAGEGQALDDGQAVDDVAGEQPAAELRPLAPAETPPSSPHRPRLQLLGGGRRAKAAKPAKASRRRVSLESTLTGAWEVLSAAAAKSGLAPTARVLGLQAPVAGVVLEEALRGTVVDRMLQPLARSGDKMGGVYALLAPPLIVSALSMQPERAPMLLPMLRGALRQWVLIAGPAIKKRQKAEAKAVEDLELPDGQTVDDLVESWLESFWAPPGAAVPDAA